MLKKEKILLATFYKPCSTIIKVGRGNTPSLKMLYPPNHPHRQLSIPPPLFPLSTPQQFSHPAHSGTHGQVLRHTSPNLARQCATYSLNWPDLVRPWLVSSITAGGSLNRQLDKVNKQESAGVRTSELWN